MVATVTYNAPEGDSEVVVTRGIKFFNGQAQELDPKEHGALIKKAMRNPHFMVEGDFDLEEDKPRRGRPPKQQAD